MEHQHLALPACCKILLRLPREYLAGLCQGVPRGITPSDSIKKVYWEGEESGCLKTNGVEATKGEDRKKEEDRKRGGRGEGEGQGEREERGRGGGVASCLLLQPCCRIWLSGQVGGDDESCG